MPIYIATVMYGLMLSLLLIYKNYNVYHIVYMSVISEEWVSITSPSFFALYLLVSMCLRLFIVVLQKLHCSANCLHVDINRVLVFYHFTKFCCSTLFSF